MSRDGVRRPIPLVLRLAALGLVVACGALLCAPFVRTIQYGVWTVRDLTRWKEKTSPLEQRVIDDICKRFSLRDGDPRCQPGAVVYAPDFFADITRRFRERDGVFSTYDEVQEALGTYQYRYDPVVTTGDGLSYFRAHYDLKGDRVFPITMFFYEDGRVFRIIADLAD